jgi:hypothetical protein
MEPESLLPYSQVPATCPYPEPDFLKFGIRHIFRKVIDIKFDRNISSASSNDMYGQTDGQEEGKAPLTTIQAQPKVRYFEFITRLNGSC